MKGPSGEEIQRAVENMATMGAVPAEVQPCSLAQYRAIIGRLPRPSAEQIANFVEAVSSAHSWYKHLPKLPPGTPFWFFLDPLAGHNRTVRPGGRVVYEARDRNQTEHHPWGTTEEYHARFGYLTYASPAGTSVAFESGGVVYERDNLHYVATTSQAYLLPPEIIEAGSVWLTAAVHNGARSGLEWKRALEDNFRQRPQGMDGGWPAETGGDETARQIIAACDRVKAAFQSEVERRRTAMPTESDRQYGQIDAAYAELAALFLPEQQRLKRTMTEAVNRLLLLLDEKIR